MAEAKLAFGLAAELELAVMEEMMVSSEKHQAVAAGVRACFAPSDDMAHVEIAAPVAAGHAAAVAQHHRTAQGCG